MTRQGLHSTSTTTTTLAQAVADNAQVIDRIDDVVGLVQPPAPLRLHLNEAVADPGDPLACYPDSAPLVAALAQLHGIPPANVLLTSGADGALEAACRAASGAVVLLDPDFPRYRQHAENAHLAIRPVTLGALPAIFPATSVLSTIGPETGAIILSTVGNPTGYRLPGDRFIHTLRERAPSALLVIDEVYSLFVGVDYTQLAVATPGMLSIRSLSKVGFAGLRVGYALGHPATLARLARFVSPYAVTGPSIVAGLHAVQQHQAWQTTIRRQQAAGAWLCGQLAERGIPCYASPANWVLASFGPGAAGVARALADRAILVQQPSHPALTDVLRMSTPDRPSVERLVCTLDRLLGHHTLLSPSFT